jgi:glycosidase
MTAWPKCPAIYEINTWVWLAELSQTLAKPIDLSCVPAEAWDDIAKFGFDAVWLMGVWERSAAGIAIANRNESLLADFRRALPDFRLEDNVGSPYCVRNYVVDKSLGGPKGLAIARRELAKRGMKLLLDFVPNHVAPDHPWGREHPDYFIRGEAEDAKRDPATFCTIRGKVFACGKDPYFPAWPDVLQLNAFEPGLRKAGIETVSNIASQCDGIRCDMAMLLLNEIFERTWGSRAGVRPATEYWTEVIPRIKQGYPEFLFIAETYWDLEWELQQKGFDFCYDKKLYDRLELGNAESIRLHLCAELGYQEKLVRFIENHDEPRAAATFSPAKERAAALMVSTLPGAKLLHEGQFEGKKTRLPVFLVRRPQEAVDAGLRDFYESLLKAVDRPLFRDSEWNLFERTGWADNASFENVVAWGWKKGEERFAIVINFSENKVQARVKIPWEELRPKAWRLQDVLSGAIYDRDGNEMVDAGLYVELEGWGYHFLRCAEMA